MLVHLGHSKNSCYPSKFGRERAELLPAPFGELPMIHGLLPDVSEERLCHSGSLQTPSAVLLGTSDGVLRLSEARRGLSDVRRAAFDRLHGVPDD